MPDEARIIVDADFGPAEEAEREFERGLESREIQLPVQSAPAGAAEAAPPQNLTQAFFRQLEDIEDAIHDVTDQAAQLVDLVDSLVTDISQNVEDIAGSAQQRESEQREDIAAGREGGGGFFLGSFRGGLFSLVAKIGLLTGIIASVSQVIRLVGDRLSDTSDDLKTDFQRFIDQVADVNPAVAMAQAVREFELLRRDIDIGRAIQDDLVAALNENTRFLTSEDRRERLIAAARRAVAGQEFQTTLDDTLSGIATSLDNIRADMNSFGTQFLNWLRGDVSTPQSPAPPVAESEIPPDLREPLPPHIPGPGGVSFIIPPTAPPEGDLDGLPQSAAAPPPGGPSLPPAEPTGRPQRPDRAAPQPTPLRDDESFNAREFINSLIREIERTRGRPASRILNSAAGSGGLLIDEPEDWKEQFKDLQKRALER